MSMDSRLKKIEGRANDAGGDINMMRMKIMTARESWPVREDARGRMLEEAARAS
jgi:hypothetical protein